jgi:hypothetical protein
MSSATSFSSSSIDFFFRPRMSAIVKLCDDIVACTVVLVPWLVTLIKGVERKSLLAEGVGCEEGGSEFYSG